MHEQTAYELIEPPGLDLGVARESILTPQALSFLAALAREFAPRVSECLAARQARQRRLDEGESLHFLPQTREIRDADWTVAPIPGDLQDRRVEITGPPERKMVINAMNSGASCYMADFEDANTPTWANLVHGQYNLYDAVRHQIEYDDPHSGKHYALQDAPVVLMVRPRGWHLYDHHLRVEKQPIPAGLFDFGLYFFHNARQLMANGSGPYFYLPKMESHLEARLWNDVFLFAQERLDIPRGSIRATVLIETIPASFELHEILYELREHSAGLNCGRWDYIFSFIKRFRHRADFVIPDRQQVGMTQPFMRAYSQLVIQTCHRRNVHAMGGMAAQIPIKDDAGENLQAMNKVQADKLREVQDGHDGTWVAHPALVPVAKKIFDTHMPTANQIAKKREDVKVSEADLVEIPQGTRSDAGLRYCIRVGIQYLAAWLGGNGAVPIYHLMEDAATAEISRAQIWQWLHHRAMVDDRLLDAARLRETLEQEMQHMREELGPTHFHQERFAQAREIFEHLCLDRDFTEFLTLPAYEVLLKREGIA